jgi:DeoR family suf operon transcriptional repressor
LNEGVVFQSFFDSIDCEKQPGDIRWVVAPDLYWRMWASMYHAAGITSDSDLLDLLRSLGPVGVVDLSHRIDVTPTTVRQRLSRLLARGLVQREPIRHGRGRPRHRYRLTAQGLRLMGSNFSDLARVLWHEIAMVEDFDVRRRILRRVLKNLAASYAQQMVGNTVEEKMVSLANLLGQRQVPFSVATSPHGLPILRAHACPYPELAESDRTICVMERLLFSELLGQDLRQSDNRFEGGGCCQFEAT